MNQFKQHPLYKEDIENILRTPAIDELKGKTVLVTGATGLIGVQLIDALMSLGDVRIIAVGRSKEKAYARLGEYYNEERFLFLEQDVTAPFPTDIQPDIIIPLASNTHPTAYAQQPVETMLINLVGARQALEMARQTGAMVLYPSTVEVYGNAHSDDVFTEDYTGQLNLATSRSCYTESKRTAEALCQSYRAEYGVKVKIVRLSRVFGPTVLPTDSKASSQFIANAVQGQDIVLKSEGNQYFSYTYVADAVSAMLHVLLHGEEGVAYNISNPLCDVRLKEFAGFCAAYNGKSVIFDLPSEVERRGFSIAAKAILDNSRLAALGWQPAYDMPTAVQRTITMLTSYENENFVR